MTVPLNPLSLAKRIAKWIARSIRNRLRKNPDRFLRFCTSVVHVGANTGQERDLYESHNLSVFWIEPIPTVYERLVENLRSFSKQMAIQALLTDKAGGIAKLNISNNSGMSSSIFDLALHRDIWPDVGYVDSLQMQTETLDGLVARGDVRLPIDAIVLDTQGSELLVLKGSEAVLCQARYVKTEAADFESYKGGPTVEAIQDFLKKHSFCLIGKTLLAKHPSSGAYYDLVFKRTTLWRSYWRR